MGILRRVRMADTKTNKVRKLLQKGLTPTEIVNRLKVSRSMVYKVRGDLVASDTVSKNINKEVDTVAKSVRTLHSPPPEPTPWVAGIGAFNANKQVTPTGAFNTTKHVTPTQEEVKPKTLWQSIKEWFK
jgi:hypothetical protein